MIRPFGAALLLCTLLFVLPPAGSARAGGLPPPDLPDPRALIVACWEVSKSERVSTDPVRQRAGYDATAECLEKSIMEWLGPLGVGKNFYTRLEMRYQLDDIRSAGRRLYSMIYDNGNGCDGPCDTPAIIRHIEILEEILTDFIRIAAFHTHQTEDLVPLMPRTPILPDTIFASVESLPKPKTIIDECWAISLEDRSSINSDRQREGGLNTVLCLKDAILDLRDSRTEDEAWPPALEMDRELDRFSFAVQRFYWTVGNDSEFCGTFCGSTWFSVHLPPVSNFFSDYIRIMVARMARDSGEMNNGQAH